MPRKLVDFEQSFGMLLKHKSFPLTFMILYSRICSKGEMKYV